MADLQSLLDRVERRLSRVREYNEAAEIGGDPRLDTFTLEILSALLRALIAKEGG